MPASVVDEFSGSWYFKKTEDDGVVVKAKGERIKNKAKHLMEKVLDVKPALKEKGKDCAGKIEVGMILILLPFHRSLMKNRSLAVLASDLNMSSFFALFE